jgi:hypothetical protein
MEKILAKLAVVTDWSFNDVPPVINTSSINHALKYEI